MHPLLQPWHGLGVPVGPGGDGGQGSVPVLQELPTCRTVKRCLAGEHSHPWHVQDEDGGDLLGWDCGLEGS